MTVERYENLMDGESVIVPAGTPISEIPGDFRDLLSPEIEAAILEPDVFLKRLAEGAIPEEFRQWLTMVAEEGLSAIELHKSEVAGNDVLFRFELANGMSPAISLPGSKTAVQLPDALSSVYERIGMTKHEEWEMAGGLLPTDAIRSVAELGFWLIDEPADDPARCFAFYGTSYGDNLCFKPDGTSVWYAHEMGDFVPSGTVGEFLAAYFKSLAAGKELQPTLGLT